MTLESGLRLRLQRRKVDAWRFLACGCRPMSVAKRRGASVDQLIRFGLSRSCENVLRSRRRGTQRIVWLGECGVAPLLKSGEKLYNSRTA